MRDMMMRQATRKQEMIRQAMRRQEVMRQAMIRACLRSSAEMYCPQAEPQ